MNKISVSLGDRSYDIAIGAGVLVPEIERVLRQLPEKKIVTITDEGVPEAYARQIKNVAEKCGIEYHLIRIKNGENSKSFKVLETIVNQILDIKISRQTTLIALGGGVVGDLTGFAASILLRGVPFIQIPTTLLAMVDSSVGGKTGINTPCGKNLVGSFYQPKAVIIDTEILRSLPEREWLAGYAEIVKYAVIDDAEFFDYLENYRKESGSYPSRDEDFIQTIIRKSCQSKAAIVSRDERESGVREWLNLGHTFGHALEALVGYSGELLHGEAVAIGMILALGYSSELGLCQASDAEILENHFMNVGMDVSLRKLQERVPDKQFSPERLLDAMRHDKKVSDGKIKLILSHGIGKTVVMQADDKGLLVFWQKKLSNNNR